MKIFSNQYSKSARIITCENTRKNKGIVFSLIIVCVMGATKSIKADTIAHAFSKERQNALQQSTQVLSDIKGIDLTQTVPGMNQTPIEESYYTDVTQSESDTLENKGRAFQESDAQAKSTMHAIVSRPVFTLDEHSDVVKQSKVIEDNAKTIATSNSENDQCVIQTVQKTCQTPIRTIQKACNKTPDILIEQTSIQKTESSSGNIPAQTNTNGTLMVPFDGVITAFSVTLKSSNVWICHRTYQGKLNNVLINQMQGNCGHALGDLHFSNNHLSIHVKKNTPILFELLGTAYGKWQYANYELTMTANENQKKATVRWKESCHAS